MEGVLVRTTRQQSAELVFAAWRNDCDFWAGNWKYNRGPWKELELTHGYHSRWLARCEGWITSPSSLRIVSCQWSVVGCQRSRSLARQNTPRSAKAALRGEPVGGLVMTDDEMGAQIHRAKEAVTKLGLPEDLVRANGQQLVPSALIEFKCDVFSKMFKHREFRNSL